METARPVPIPTAIDGLMTKLYTAYLVGNEPLRPGDGDADARDKLAGTEFDCAAFTLVGGALNDLHSIAHSLDQLSVTAMMIMLKFANKLPNDVFAGKDFNPAPEQSNEQ